MYHLNFIDPTFLNARCRQDVYDSNNNMAGSSGRHGSRHPPHFAVKRNPPGWWTKNKKPKKIFGKEKNVYPNQGLFW